MHHPVQCQFFIDHEGTMPCSHAARKTAWVPTLGLWVPCCEHCGDVAAELKRDASETPEATQ